MENNYANLDIFENCVLKEDKQHPKYYILSNSYKLVDPNGTFLSKISIFNKNRGTVEKDRALVNKILEILMTNKTVQEKKELLKPFNLDPKEKRGIGSMLGMALGDAMGARYEFLSVRYNEIDLKDMGDNSVSNFRMEPGQWTDDASMGLCLADSLLMNNGKLDEHDLMHRFLCWWKGGYNNAFRFNPIPRRSVGLGGNISLSLNNIK